MAAHVFDFCQSRKEFNSVVHQVVEENSLEPYKSFIQEYVGSESEKRVTIDQALRDCLRELSSENKGCDVYRRFISLSLEIARAELCSTITPFLLLTDIFDVIPLDQCEELFGLVEDKVSVWKSPTFYDTGKNFLLRMCNEYILIRQLLQELSDQGILCLPLESSRRLSKSQNTVFCGRIQLFLSRLFPLSEKSALNLMSQFNLENVTLYNQSQSTSTEVVKEEAKDESMEVEEEEGEETKSTVPIDYNLYRKFWALQDYFRKPSQCYDKRQWGVFVNNSDAVLDAFHSSKLDDLKSSKKKLNRTRDLATDAFFAKYLTSEKLLDLQLNDSNFRRYVLVQFLIIFQYLNAPIKFKSATTVLTDDQSTWIKSTSDRIYQLIRETPPDGEDFARTVEHILTREEHWNSWKNEGCPAFERKPPKEAPKPPKRAKRRRIGEDLQASGGKVIKMGNSELTKLWNLNPNNMNACKATERMFLPTLEEFFQEAIEQNDPEQQVEEQYKLVNESTFQWKALRLLARRSPQFFTNSTTPALELKTYLNNMLSKIAKQLPSQQSEEMKTEVDDDEIKESQEEEEDLKHAEEQEKDAEPKELVLGKDIVARLAEKVAGDWKTLAIELRFPDDDIQYFDSEAGSNIDKANKVLTIWTEEDPDKNTASVLRIALKEVGMSEVAEAILGPS